MRPAPQRRLVNSQNFLRSRVLVDHLLATSSIQSGDLVLDLGAGRGLLTERLVQRGCRVIAVEKDAGLVATLRQRFAGTPAVTVWHLDILAVKLPSRPYKVFANIPFDATSAIIHRLTGSPCPPEDAYLVVQREAAERVVGRPRGTLLAALLCPWFEVAVVHRFRRTDFTPMPRVDVVMLRLRKRGPPAVVPEHAGLFRDFVVRMFTARQCSLANRLGDLLGRRRARLLMRRLAISQAATPSSVSPRQWLELFVEFQRAAEVPARLLVRGAERRLHRQQLRLRKLHRTRTRASDRPARPVRCARRGGLDSTCRPPPAAACARLLTWGSPRADGPGLWRRPGEGGHR
jgi:23S rRNA (adenine-N6)-dimethyltransferase